MYVFRNTEGIGSTKKRSVTFCTPYTIADTEQIMECFKSLVCRVLNGIQDHTVEVIKEGIILDITPMWQQLIYL